MNKSIKSLLIVALTLSAQNVGAYTNKTFMQPRNQALVNLPLIKTTWCERIGAKLEDRFGGNLEVVGFYGQNTNKSDTGKYFGVTEKNQFNLLTAANANTISASVLDPAYIIHWFNASAYTAAADGAGLTLKLDPESTHYGVDLAYHQDLSKIVNGLYLMVILPIQHVENDPKLSITELRAGAPISRDNLINYFKGIYEQTNAGASNAQEKLQYGKINGKHSATGVADIDVTLGYNFLKKETYHMGINLGISIPTGKEPTGEYMFEPLYGSKHFGLGGGLHAGARIWGDEEHNFKLAFAANYRYLFQASEKRTLGLKDRNWGQYYLLNKAALVNTLLLKPAANVLTQNVDVTPGSQLDGILGLAYNKGGFTVDLGYNMYFKESESVKIKDAWNETTYGIAARNWDHGTAIGAGDAGLCDDNKALNAGGYITKADLKTSNAATDSQFTHSIYGGLGYAFKNWEYPLMLGLGGKYEFASKNSALEGWQGWIKAGLSF